MAGHKFKKGDPRPAKAGRRAGIPNKTTTLLKQAILAAGESVGFVVWKGRGKNRKPVFGERGLQGYLEWMALFEPKSYAQLLGRVLPLQITGEGGGPVRFIDESMSAATAANVYAEQLKALPPPMIDVTPKVSNTAPLPRVIPKRSLSTTQH